MLPTKWTPEAARAGIKQEDIEAANDRVDRAAQAGMQAELARIPALRARAQQMLAVFKTGPEYADLAGAITDLDSNAPTPAHQAVAARRLDAAIQRWSQSFVIAEAMERAAAPALAQQAALRAAEERRPKPLTVEQRLDRIEKQLGLS